MTYDTALAELNDILRSLQSDEAGLDHLGQQLKRAAELTEFCKKALRSLEADIEKISPIE